VSGVPVAQTRPNSLSGPRPLSPDGHGTRDEGTPEERRRRCRRAGLESGHKREPAEWRFHQFIHALLVWGEMLIKSVRRHWLFASRWKRSQLSTPTLYTNTSRKHQGTNQRRMHARQTTSPIRGYMIASEWRGTHGSAEDWRRALHGTRGIRLIFDLFSPKRSLLPNLQGRANTPVSFRSFMQSPVTRSGRTHLQAGCTPLRSSLACP
jgi:hypothetical protein